jgi:hypothetical protein
MSGRYLYHGTGIYALASIVETDALYEGVHWGKPNEPRGPRLTEDYDIAKGFIEYAVHWGEGGILVFDRELLENDYDLVEYQDKRYDGGDFGRNEWEVACVTPKIENLSRYLVSVVCEPEVIRMAMKRSFQEQAFSECGWIHAWGPPSRSFGRRNMVRAFDDLAGSPFLNSAAFEPETRPIIGNWLKAPALESAHSGMRM